MKEIKSKITINAPANQVWATLMNFENYHSWNPFIKSISGEAKVGSKLKTSIHPPGQSPMDFQPIVLKATQNQEFRWKGKLFINGIFDGEHYFVLESTSPNETIFHHGEKFTGLLSGLIFRMIEESTLAGFESMNEAIKKVVEDG